MEGGVRPSRTSSRYASSGPSPAVFNGPVRKWKKQWVTTSAPPLLLCRWTPISAAAAADQPSVRRCRYAPVVPIERGNAKAPEKVTSDGGGARPNNDGGDGTVERPPTTGDIMIQAEEVSEDEEDSNKREGNGDSCSEKRRKLSPGRPKC